MKRAGESIERASFGSNIAGVVFFGTPVADQKMVKLKRTLRIHATVELRLVQEDAPQLDDDAAREMLGVLKYLDHEKFPVVSIFEEVESEFGHKFMSLSTPNKKVVRY